MVGICREWSVRPAGAGSIGGGGEFMNYRRLIAGAARGYVRAAMFVFFVSFVVALAFDIATRLFAD